MLGQDPGTADRAWQARVGIVLAGRVGGGRADGRRDRTALRRATTRGRATRPRSSTLVGLTGKAGSRIKALSGGQRRRLDVALGVIGGPELLLLDEPTTGFDPAARRQFWALIRRLADEGTTIMLTTHYLDEAEALADRLAVIAGGQGRRRGRTRPRWPAARRRGRPCTGREPDGTARSERTDTPTRTVAELMPPLRRRDPRTRVTRPTLEDVYLRLTGSEDTRWPAPPHGGARPRAGRPHRTAAGRVAAGPAARGAGDPDVLPAARAGGLHLRLPHRLPVPVRLDLPRRHGGHRVHRVPVLRRPR